jgi:hypothetical protein
MFSVGIIVNILDIIAMVGTIICLNLTSKTHKAWLLYLIPTACFIALMIIERIPGQIVMGLFLFGTGIRNYVIYQKRNSKSE